MITKWAFKLIGKVITLILLLTISPLCEKECDFMPWEKYGFSSPQAYATEISRKESAGETFTQPQAAEQFKAANPSLFTPQQQLSNATGRPDSFWTDMGLKPPDPNAPSSADEAAATKQWEIDTFGNYSTVGQGAIPDDKQVFIWQYNPITGEYTPSSVEHADYFNPAGGSHGSWVPGHDAYVFTPGGQPTQPIQPTQQQQFSPNYMMNQITPIFNEYMSIWESTVGNVELAPLVTQAFTQLMTTIEQAEVSIRKQFEEQMGGVDPATQAALARLKDTVKDQQRSMMEEMSRRGLLQSGIWLEAESRLAQGHLTAEQQMLGDRLSKLQDQLNQTLMNFANTRINATQQYGIEGLRAMEADVQRRQDAMATNLQNAIQMAQWQDQQALSWYNAQAPYTLVPEVERYDPAKELAGATGTGTAPPADPSKQLDWRF